MTIERESAGEGSRKVTAASKYVGLELRMETLGFFGLDWIRVERQKDLQSRGLLRFDGAVLGKIVGVRIFKRRKNPDGSRSCFRGDGAMVDPTCKADPTALICEGAYVGKGTELGRLSVVGVGAQVEQSVKIGEGVVVKPGEVVKESRRFNATMVQRRERQRSLLDSIAAASLGGVKLTVGPPYDRVKKRGGE